MWVGNSPLGIQQLIAETAQTEPEPIVQIEDDAPCSDEEAERILGVHFAPKLSHITHDVLSIQESVAPAQDTNGFRQTGETSTEVVLDSMPVLSDVAPNVLSDAPTEPQHIRVYKPQSFPPHGTALDDVQSAIIQAKT